MEQKRFHARFNTQERVIADKVTNYVDDTNINKNHSLSVQNVIRNLFHGPMVQRDGMNSRTFRYQEEGQGDIPWDSGMGWTIYWTSLYFTRDKIFIIKYISKQFGCAHIKGMFHVEYC